MNTIEQITHVGERPVSHANRMKGQYQSNRQQILYLTGMTDQDLNEFQFETGIAWLRTFTGDDTELLRAVLKNELVWAWWINNWNAFDNERVLPLLYHIRGKECLQRYRNMHNECFVRLTPPYCILEESYLQLGWDKVNFPV